MAMAIGYWKPVEADAAIGNLPLTTGDRREFTVPLPDDAGARPTQVLIYSYITVHEADPGFHRGYYTISTETEDGSTEYIYYMNVAKTAGTVVNSGNYWLPFGDGIKASVYVELFNAEYGTQAAPIRSKGKTTADQYGGGEVFLTGYNMVPVLPPQK